MNFKEWLLNEGAAIIPSEDMKKFAQEVWIMLMRLTPIDSDEHKRDVFGRPFVSREVTDRKGNSRLVTVKFQDKKIGKFGSRTYGDANPDTGEINIYLPLNEKGYPNYPGFDGFYFLKEIVIHELIHLFDPKLNNNSLRLTKWGRDNKPAKTYEDYAKSPHEVDAFIGSHANEIFEYFRQKYGYYDDIVPAITYYIKNVQPTWPIEKLWYDDHLANNKKGRSLWIRYKKTLAKILEEYKSRANHKSRAAKMTQHRRNVLQYQKDKLSPPVEPDPITAELLAIQKTLQNFDTSIPTLALKRLHKINDRLRSLYFKMNKPQRDLYFAISDLDSKLTNIITSKALGRKRRS